MFSALIIRFSIIISCFIWLSAAGIAAAKSNTYEIMVHAGQFEETIAYFKSKNFWGESTHNKNLDVPRILVVMISERWGKEVQKIPVEVKKELFYRALVPLVLYANELILKERQELMAISEILRKGKTLNSEELSHLQSIGQKYGLQEVDDPKERVVQLLERVDIIPPSLALGQTAYESGYGTSRFAVEGNALFGQWTYSGDGMKPQQQRKGKGDYGVAAYKWPFDSVRSYMYNLNTHSAYQELRDRRAALRKQGKEPTGLALAETLTRYSEKGREYIKTLKSIITVNNLEVTDNAYLRDEPMTLVVGVDNVSKVKDAESEIDQLRTSGELDRIVKSMLLGGVK